MNHAMNDLFHSAVALFPLLTHSLKVCKKWFLKSVCTSLVGLSSRFGVLSRIMATVTDLMVRPRWLQLFHFKTFIIAYPSTCHHIISTLIRPPVVVSRVCCPSRRNLDACNRQRWFFNDLSRYLRAAKPLIVRNKPELSMIERRRQW